MLAASFMHLKVREGRGPSSRCSSGGASVLQEGRGHRPWEAYVPVTLVMLVVKRYN